VKPIAIVWFLSVIGWLGSSALAAEGTKLPFDTYSGYFVSNRFETDAAQSFVVIHDQEQFDQVFGVAMVMRDKSHRIAKKAFKSQLVLAVIQRGSAIWEFKIESVTFNQGVVTLRYTTTAKPSDSATFACPLIVSIPKGKYTAVRFVENQKTVKKVSMENGPSATSPHP
jgi:sterol desaturase/sphingolipid hydroxylase (fatty acid hydroxylase superfamily)